MRKILTVFLLFVSFNLFAQKQEIGRITWEFREYGNITPISIIPERHRDKIWHELETLIYFESNNEGIRNSLYADLMAYINTKDTPDGVSQVISRNQNGAKILENYVYDNSRNKLGIWGALGIYGINPSGMNDELAKNRNKLIYIYAENYLQRALFRKSGSKDKNYTFKTLFDINEEEYYWINKIRVDENGVKHHNLKAIFVLYEE